MILAVLMLLPCIFFAVLRTALRGLSSKPQRLLIFLGGGCCSRNLCMSQPACMTSLTAACVLKTTKCCRTGCAGCSCCSVMHDCIMHGHICPMREVVKKPVWRLRANWDLPLLPHAQPILVASWSPPPFLSSHVPILSHTLFCIPCCQLSSFM